MSSAIDEGLQLIASDISHGFESVLAQLDAQSKIERDLRQQLAKAVRRCNSSTSDNPSDGAFSAWQEEIVKQISEAPAQAETSVTTNNPSISKAKEALANLKDKINMTASMPPKRCPVSHKSPPAETAMNLTPRKCPVAHVQPATNYEEMEKDFTTQGKPSSLECPFAAMTKDGLPAGLGERDPIAAEFHADVLSAQSLDEARSCGRCPIRFLDKHSPEEVAEYFEKHKHELPRSHEICVKRYQQNETSIRQLDAKYGNLVSMIQGLGNKHKQYLPDDERAASGDQASSEAVQKWAQAVDENAPPNEVVKEEESDERESRFEKPLREIRVGESPSRPWGIQVPQIPADGVSDVDSRPIVVNPHVSLGQDKPHLQPVANTVNEEVASTDRATSRASSSRKSRSKRPNQIIFNGPVFIGYAPEQAAAFLAQLQNLDIGNVSAK